MSLQQPALIQRCQFDPATTLELRHLAGDSLKSQTQKFCHIAAAHGQVEFSVSAFLAKARDREEESSNLLFGRLCADGCKLSLRGAQLTPDLPEHLLRERRVASVDVVDAACRNRPDDN